MTFKRSDSYLGLLSSGSEPSGLELPWQWRDFSPAKGEKSCAPAEWANYAEQLPWVCAWIKQCVLGTVVAVKDKPYLMYVYREEGRLNFYMGGAPLGGGECTTG